MTQVDEVIADLVLSHERGERIYDPVKRKEYYERTKKLKGRAGQNLPERQGNPNVAVAPDLNKAEKKAISKAKKSAERLKRLKSLDGKLKRAEQAAGKIPFDGPRKKALSKIKAQRSKLDDQLSTARAKKQAADNTRSEISTAKKSEEIRVKRDAENRQKSIDAQRKESNRRKNSIGTKLGNQADKVRKAIDKSNKADRERIKRLQNLEKKVKKGAKDWSELKPVRDKARSRGAKDKKKISSFVDQVKKDYRRARDAKP